MKEFFRRAIQAQIQKGEYRQRLVLHGGQGVRQELNGRTLISFCSNDYLALAQHPDIKAAMITGCEQEGVGSGAAHLINGHSQVHQELEIALAKFTQRPAALLFSTGYMANLAVISSIMGRHDRIIADRLVHASLLDACKLSGAKLHRFEHNQSESAEKKLAQDHGHKTLLLTEGVFSMDGDQAPLESLTRLAQQYHACFMLDDAHGFGVLGQWGGGSSEAAGLDHQRVPILMATLGKAVGCFGAFVAGDEDLIDYLIQFARPYLFTTASPPALAYAALASLQIIKAEHWRRDKLKELIIYFVQSAQQLDLPLLSSQSPIQGILLGDSHKANALSATLLKQGFLVKAIRPPTVPEGTARLRITLSCEHEKENLQDLLQAIHQGLEQYGH